MSSPEAYNGEILRLLKEINERVGRIEGRLAGAPRASGSPGGDVAPDSDLDSQYGDPEVRKDPKRWIEGGGESFVGMPFSRCPAEYLDSLAGFKEWQAQKDQEAGIPEKQKYVGYARKDAARARGWAARLRSGWTAPTFGGGGAGARPPRAADVGGTDGKGSDDFGFGDNDADIPFATSLPNRRGL